MRSTHIVYTVLKVTLCFAAVGCQRSEFAATSLVEANMADWGQSEFTVTDPNLADGETAAVVTVVLRNSKGQPIKGEHIDLSFTGAESGVLPCRETDSRGETICKMTTVIPGRRHFSIKQFKATREAQFIKLKVAAVPFGVVSGGDRQATLLGQTFTTAVGIAETEFKRTTVDLSITMTSSHLAPLIETEVR